MIPTLECFETDQSFPEALSPQEILGKLLISLASAWVIIDQSFQIESHAPWSPECKLLIYLAGAWLIIDQLFQIVFTAIKNAMESNEGKLLFFRKCLADN